MLNLSPPRKTGPRVVAIVAWASVALLTAASPIRVFAADLSYCRDPTVNRLVNQAAQDGLDEPQLRALSHRFALQNAPRCDGVLPDGVVASCIGLKVALASVDQAYARLSAPTPDLDAAYSLLSEGRSHGAPWQLLVGLGDLEATRAQQSGKADGYLEAARSLQAALNAINEPVLCATFGEVRPELEQIRRIKKRAQEAVMLSPHFEVARTKQGDCGGIFLQTVRGVDVESVPVPITFDYDKASFTAEGKKAADSLLACVREKHLSSLTLSGHTDAHGSDGYNMDLSARRLNAVGDYLKASGFTGQMRLVPLGKREPFQPDDPKQHSSEQIDQMNRRVELREVAP